jgi:NitT/TauT family transport system ATP-binding protein
MSAASTASQGHVSVRDLSLHFPTRKGRAVPALEHISLEIEANAFTVIVGPSGCGKSSLLTLIAGLTNATGGGIFLDGAPVDGPGPERGMVFQSYTLFPWLTVRQNVAFGLKRQGRAWGAIVDDYLDAVGLTAFADHYPKHLSGGMMQRVAIARALAADPRILLMDEPFGALDSQTRLAMQELLLRVWEKHKKTVLFVTHDIEEAILLADVILVMTGRPGRIKARLEPKFARPRPIDLILEPEFTALKRQIFAELHNV